MPAVSPGPAAVCAGRFLRSELLDMQYGSLYMPSTGALMLLTALHTCDQVRGHRDTFLLGTGPSPASAAGALVTSCCEAAWQDWHSLVAVLHVPPLCPQSGAWST